MSSISGGSTPTAGRASALAPFRVKSFRFQWPADLCASWAFEMEALILGWYVLTETGSVKMLVVFAALQWGGALFSPLFGVAGDRLGHRTLLCSTRALYAVLAALLLLLIISGVLVPWHVFAIFTLVGLVRPSDMVMRHSLIGQTMTPALLMGALGLSRLTADSARIAGALAGAGVVAVFGMAPAYVMVMGLYVISFVLSTRVAGAPRAAVDVGADADIVPAGATPVSAAPATPLKDLRTGFAYVWGKPELMAALAMAFLVNLLAFPFVMGLLPYVAKDVYGTNQTGLGYLAAAFATGGLVGSLLLSSNRIPLRAARTMVLAGSAWLFMLLIFAQTRTLTAGIGVLLITGIAHNLCLMPIAAVMLRGAADEMRGRVMGMRMLAIWGLPIGLLLAGPLIAAFGFTVVLSSYALVGLLLVLAIAWRWRHGVWLLSAPANARL